MGGVSNAEGDGAEVGFRIFKSFPFYLQLIQWRLPELIMAWRGGRAAGGGEEADLIA